MMDRLVLVVILFAGCGDAKVSSNSKTQAPRTTTEPATPKLDRGPTTPKLDRGPATPKLDRGPTNPSEVEAKALPAALTDPQRFDCKTDTDCQNSCKHGAVSSEWYRAAEELPNFPECEDGCKNQISAPPRCEAGGCVAYQIDPQDETHVSRLDRCTGIGKLE